MIERDRRAGRLTRKVTVVILLLGVLLTTSISITCYIEFTSIVEMMYHNEAHQIGGIINSYITDDFKSLIVDYRNVRNYGTPDEIKEFEKKMAESPDYKSLTKLMESFRDDMGIAQMFIYDFMQSDGSVGESYTTIIDVVNDDLKEREQKYIGSTGQLDKKNTDILRSVYSSGKQTGEPLSYKAETAYSIVALVPIIYRRDRIIGIIGVEDPMVSLESARGRFIYLTIVIASVLTILIIFGFIIYNRKNFLKPLHRMIDETKQFIDNSGGPRDTFEDIKTNDDLEILGESIVTMENAIENYIEHIERVTKEQERVETELDVATKIQYGLLPNQFPYFPDHDEFDIYGFMQTAREVGGDFYDFFFLDEDHLGIVIADVSGKGIPAALFMSVSKTLIKSHSVKSDDYASIFTDVNNSLWENNQEEMFVTALMGIYELSTGKLFLINAGHNPPLIMNQNGTYEYKQMLPGLVLGIVPGITYTAFETELKPGEKLFVYTDGIVEAQNAQEELYGEERLQKILNQCSSLSPEKTLRAVKEDVDQFVGKVQQFDDMTMVCFEVKK